MILISICDDNAEQMQHIKSSIEKTKISVDITIKTFNNFQKLLYHLEETAGIPQIVFLDIKLKDNDGIEVAKQINTHFLYCQIIFVSAYPQYFEQVYLAEHVAFISKPIQDEYLQNAINRALRNLKQNEPHHLSIISEGKGILIDIAEIRFIERQKRITNIHISENEIKPTYETFESLLDKADNPVLLRCHESYIVNLKYVKRFDGNTFIFDNNQYVPVSRRYKNEVSAVFYQYVSEVL